jgi:hypothetical protein
MAKWNLERLLEKRRIPIQTWLEENHISCMEQYINVLFSADLMSTESLTKKVKSILEPKLISEYVIVPEFSDPKPETPRKKKSPAPKMEE